MRAAKSPPNPPALLLGSETETEKDFFNEDTSRRGRGASSPPRFLGGPSLHQTDVRAALPPCLPHQLSSLNF